MLKLNMPLRRLIPGFCLVLVACASAPQAERHDMPLPANFPALPASTGPTAQASGLGWKSLFLDPHLHGLIEHALAHNSDLYAASARVAEARAAYQIQNADRLPSVGLGGEGTRSRTPADLSVTGQPLLANQFQVGLTAASYELDFWGRVKSLNEVALARYLATEEARQAFQVSLIGMVAKSYLQGLEFNERIKLAEKTVLSREESLRIMQLRVNVGSNSDLELRQVQTLLFSTRSELAALERQRAQNMALSDQLTGYATAPSQPPLALDAQGLERDIAPGLPADLLLQRPDLRAAEQQLRASRANVSAARAAFFPRVTITGSGGTASSEFDNLFHSGGSAWSFAPSISLPIFDGGRTQSNLALAEARKHLAVANYESSVRGAFREVADALAAQYWLKVQLAQQIELVNAETDRSRLADLRYERGAIGYLDVLDAKRALFNAEQVLVQLRRARLSSTVDLYLALGGGSDAELLVSTPVPLTLSKE